MKIRSPETRLPNVFPLLLQTLDIFISFLLLVKWVLKKDGWRSGVIARPVLTLLISRRSKPV
jgi:hypothetical protein